MHLKSAKTLCSKVLKSFITIFKLNPNLCVKGLIYLIDVFKD